MAAPVAMAKVEMLNLAPVSSVGSPKMEICLAFLDFFSWLTNTVVGLVSKRIAPSGLPVREENGRACRRKQLKRSISGMLLDHRE